MSFPDDPTIALPPEPEPRGPGEPGRRSDRDRRAIAIFAGMGLALVAGIIIWAIASSGDGDDSISIGSTSSSAVTTSTLAPTQPTTQPTLPPSVITVPTTTFTPGSVIVVPTAPPVTNPATQPPTSPPPTAGPTSTTSGPTPTTRPRLDTAALEQTLTDVLLGPDADPPLEPIVEVTARGRRGLRVTWLIGNPEDLDLAKTGAYDEAIAMLQALVGLPELEGRRIVLDGEYPLDQDGDGVPEPAERVIRLSFPAGAFDGVDLGSLDAAGLVSLADPSNIDPEFEPAGLPPETTTTSTTDP